MADVVLRAMVPGDALQVLAVQRAAFAREAELYAGAHLPPLLETAAELAVDLETSAGFVAVIGSSVVGSVRVRVQDGRAHVARLAVAPGLQGRGIGAALLALAERAAPAATEAVLFTGSLSEGNLRLYARAGYVETGREQAADGITLVHLRKPLR